MTADSGRVPFYVVFSDGNNETNVGTVMVDPTMNFRCLLSLLSQKIGISPHQLNMFQATIGSDRRIPITTKFNLTTALSDPGNYYFFVKRLRSSKKSPSNGKNSNPNNNNQSQNVKHLRRDNTGEVTSFSTSLGVNGDSIGKEMTSNFGGSYAVCEVCSRTKLTGIDVDFHLCVHDEMTVGFQTTAGPISRPTRNSSKITP